MGSIRSGLRMEERNILVRALVGGASWREAAAQITNCEPAAVEGWKEWAQAEAKRRIAEAPQASEDAAIYTEQDVLEHAEKATAAIKGQLKAEQDKVAKLAAEVAQLKEKLDFLGGDGKAKK